MSFIPEGVTFGFSVKEALVVAMVVVGDSVVHGLGTCAVDLCSQSTWAAWLQQLHLGSNLKLAAHFFTTGSVSVQRRKVRHSGSA